MMTTTPTLQGGSKTIPPMPNGTEIKLKDCSFHIVKTLGNGSYGIVYLANKMIGDSFEGSFAIKEFISYERPRTIDEHTFVLNLESSAVQKEFSAFVSEYNVLSLLKHENIIKVYDFFLWNGKAFFTMEYMENGTLLDRVCTPQLSKNLTEKEALHIIEQISSALGYLHAKTIYHNDIKINNILVRKNGDCVLADFGRLTFSLPYSCRSCFISDLFDLSNLLFQLLVGDYTNLYKSNDDKIKELQRYGISGVVIQKIINYSKYTSVNEWLYNKDDFFDLQKKEIKDLICQFDSLSGTFDNIPQNVQEEIDKIQLKYDYVSRLGKIHIPHGGPYSSFNYIYGVVCIKNDLVDVYRYECINIDGKFSPKKELKFFAKYVSMTINRWNELKYAT